MLTAVQLKEWFLFVSATDYRNWKNFDVTFQFSRNCKGRKVFRFNLKDLIFDLTKESLTDLSCGGIDLEVGDVVRVGSPKSSMIGNVLGDFPKEKSGVQRRIAAFGLLKVRVGEFWQRRTVFNWPVAVLVDEGGSEGKSFVVNSEDRLCLFDLSSLIKVKE